MARSLASPGRSLRDAWRRLSPLPGGRTLFSLGLGRFVPYSGSIGARVELLEPGHARVTLREHRAVRNHLRSVHAVALVNLLELTSGLAMLAGLPDELRAIVLHLEVDFVKKARGILTAECRCVPPSARVEQEAWLEPAVTDAVGDVVARGRVQWLVRPVEPAHA
jgi:acyl-coenzyme A thioesterase PaaI-like protein